MNEEEKKQRQAQIEARIKATRNAYRNIFRTEDGQKVLDDLKAVTYYNFTPYRQGVDGTHLAFCEGARSVVLYILNMLNMAKKEEG